MSDRVLTEQCLTAFRHRLLGEEKSPATVEKYMRDARSFWAFTGGDPVDKLSLIHI